MAALGSGNATNEGLLGRTAVVTGGGTGMGRELVRQLVAEGCNVAMCDVSARKHARIKVFAKQHGRDRACASRRMSPTCQTRRRSCRFRDAVMAQQETDKIHLLFNNAGISGGGKHHRQHPR